MAYGVDYRDTIKPVNTADFTNVTLLTTQTALWAVGAATLGPILPAGFWVVGRSVKVTANVKWVAVANTNTITFSLAAGTASAPGCHVDSLAFTAVSSTSTFDLIFEGYATCRSVGTAGTLSMFGKVIVPVGLIASTTANGVCMPSAGVTVVGTVDTTQAMEVFFQAARATTAGDTITTTNVFVEALN